MAKFVVHCPLFTTRPFPTRERAEKEKEVIEDQGFCDHEHEVVEEELLLPLPPNDMPREVLVDDEGRSLSGSCSHCRRVVDNHDENHRVSAIFQGGRGVECVVRGDIQPLQARPLGCQ